MTLKNMRRCLCGVFAALFFCTLLPQPISAQETTYDDFRKRYDIAIVFDNSGSMYGDTERWCRAKYAMEIFASMLHYENGDRLTIYPMWKTVTDGTQPSAEGGYLSEFSIVEPITVRSKEDIDKISNLYTVYASQTPYEPVEEAYQALLDSDIQEKWLVILSDGAFNYEKRLDAADKSNEKEITGIELQSRLEAMASERIKVQYLGFGSSTAIEEKRAQYLYAEQSNDENLRSKLVDICNVIFQRSDLLKQAPAAFDEATGKLTLDMSMRSLIVFAQGKDASIGSLKTETGEEIAVTLDSGQRTYSRIAAGSHGLPGSGAKNENAKIDTSLAGQVVTFADCAAGSYTLDVSGQTELQIFYEPNVEIAYSFTGDDGEVYNSLNELPEKEILPGEYIVHYWIADSVTHEDVTKSPLLGSNVAFTAEVEYSDGRIEEIINGGGLMLEPEQSVFMKITGKYLNQYRITTEDDRDNATLYVTAPEQEILALTLTQTQPHEWYKQDDWAEWEPICAKLTLSGRPLTDEQLAAVEFDTEFAGDEVPCQFRMLSGESAYEILLSRDGTGAYAESETGERTMTVKASLTDEYERLLKAEDSVGFRIEPLGFWTITLIILGVIVAIAVLWLIFMLQKVMPKKIVCSNFEMIGHGLGAAFTPEVICNYNRSARTLELYSGIAGAKLYCHIRLSLEPVDHHFKKSSARRVRVIRITTDMPADLHNAPEAEIGGMAFVYDQAQAMLVPETGGPVGITMSSGSQVNMVNRDHIGLNCILQYH